MSLSIRQTAASTGGNMYWPPGNPRGGIVCLHGSEGGWAGWNDLSSALFAAHGFAALSHNYTKVMQWPTPPDIDDVPLEGTVDALNTMQAEMAPFGCGVGRPAWSWRGSHERTRPGTPLCPGVVPYPVFVAQGTDDRTWDADMARRLVARLTDNGCSPEAHFFEGEGHIFRAPARNREWELMTEFFGKHLAKTG